MDSHRGLRSVPTGPSAESLAEVHAEAVIREAARRARAELDVAPPVTPESRRGLVVTLVAGVALLGMAVWPSVSSAFAGDPKPPATVYQHSASATSTASGAHWDPWRDPFPRP